MHKIPIFVVNLELEQYPQHLYLFSKDFFLKIKAWRFTGNVEILEYFGKKDSSL